MSISREEVQKIAQLCRLRFSDSEIEMYQKQLSDIVGYINKLQEVDTSDIEETMSMGEHTTGHMRKDKVHEEFDRAQMLAASQLPLENGSVKVPNVIQRKSA